VVSRRLKLLAERIVSGMPFVAVGMSVAGHPCAERRIAAVPFLTIDRNLAVVMTYAVLGAVYAEYVGAFDGLGIWILTSQKSFRIDLVFGAVLIVLVISVALFALVGALERALVPWAAEARQRSRRPA